MTHFLNESGNIPKQIPKEARELASFFALIIDETTKRNPSVQIITDIKCFEKKCNGIIKSEYIKATNEIYWKCSNCPNEGRISDWQNTKWDNR